MSSSSMKRVKILFPDFEVRSNFILALGEREAENNDDIDDNDETTASRFTAYLLDFLLGGFLAKDKTVRFRVLFALREMITHLGEIECVHFFISLMSRN
jgi:hypothetical protein